MPCQELDEVHREMLVQRIVQLMPERWGSLSRAVMGFMAKDQVLAVSREVIVNRPEVGVCHRVTVCITFLPPSAACLNARV